MSNSGNDFAVYFHLPFCRRKCPYCDFYSRPYHQTEIRRLIDAVTSEIESSPYRGNRISSIFLGGGTPSTIDPSEIERLLSALFDHFNVAKSLVNGLPSRHPKPEWTIECNPESLSLTHIRSLLLLGFNRFSLGAQTFSDRLLGKLGRSHTSRNILDSFRQLRKQGISNINLDLMFGIPGQTLDNWIEDLTQAVSLGPEHLSIYGLSIEPETEFGRLQRNGQLDLPGEEVEAEIYEWTLKYLKDSGYRQYEISNFAFPGFECRHILCYWLNSTYLGFGPSAASFDGRLRWTNTSNWETYLESACQGSVVRENEEELVGVEKFSEDLILRLRLNRGIALEELANNAQLDKHPPIDRAVNDLIEDSLLEKTSDRRLCLTDRGRLLASEVSIRLMRAIEEDQF